MVFFKKWFKFYGAQQPQTTPIPRRTVPGIGAWCRRCLCCSSIYSHLCSFVLRVVEPWRALVRSCEFSRVSEEIHETYLIYCGELFASLKNRNNNRTGRKFYAHYLAYNITLPPSLFVPSSRCRCVLVHLKAARFSSIRNLYSHRIDFKLGWTYRRHGLYYWVCIRERFPNCERVSYTLPHARQSMVAYTLRHQNECQHLSKLSARGNVFDVLCVSIGVCIDKAATEIRYFIHIMCDGAGAAVCMQPILITLNM